MIFFFLFSILPVLLWIKHPHPLEKELESGAVISWSPGADFWFPVISMFFLIHSLFCVGHGENLYEYTTETGGIAGLAFSFAFVLGTMLLSGLKSDHRPKDHLRKARLYWFIGLPITGIFIGFNIILKKYPEKFHGFDEYTMHEILTKCIPCSLIGSFITTAVCAGICILVWYMRENKDRY